MPYDAGATTIHVKLNLNMALLEYQSQVVLEKVGYDVTHFNRHQLTQAWGKAIQDHLARQAQDTDFLLAQNGNDEVFLDALAVA